MRAFDSVQYYFNPGNTIIYRNSECYMNPLNIIGGSRRRPTFCRNDAYCDYLRDKATKSLITDRDWFYRYFYCYVMARKEVNQSNNGTIKQAAHFKKCLRQSADKLRQELERK